MDVFTIRDKIVAEYESFSRSFCKIRAEDLSAYVEERHREKTFWPSPLIQLNPHFIPGKSLSELSEEGLIMDECSQIFRLNKESDGIGRALPLHAHQEEAIRLAAADQPFILTSGTGSGKSLSYFIPIVDHVLRQKKAPEKNGTKRIYALAVYPMNALCNSQIEELRKFIGDDGPVTFARYTGQETNEERQRLADHPPDILLTNYMMLELLLTHHDVKDRAILEAARGLRFLVLDELHTYRGRQGADVAMLVRRVRQKLSSDLLCIGTSATMASEGNAQQQREAIACYGSRLFGTPITAEQIVREKLKRMTLGEVQREALRASVEHYDKNEDRAALISPQDPLAIWVETTLGLEFSSESVWIRRRKPLCFDTAVELLSKESSLPTERCEEALKSFFSRAQHSSEGKNGRQLFAFRLHQFVSGAGTLYTTLEPAGERVCSLEAQLYLPGDRSKKLFNVCFCRECGQEYYPVWGLMSHKETLELEPRGLDERRGGDEEAGNQDEEIEGKEALFWAPDSGLSFDRENVDLYPEEWIESEKGDTRLKKGYRRLIPRPFSVGTDGKACREGVNGWLLRAPFRFCLQCKVYYPTRKADRNKLSSLSSEGRSSAMTVLSLSSLKQLQQGSLPKEAQKLLAFTDNRQDASLQAGHFNDFIHILHLRSALLAALYQSEEKCLTEETIAREVQRYLQLDLPDYSENPELRGPLLNKTEKALRDVVGSRIMRDLQKGWRITSPNLEQLSLLTIDYEALADCCSDDEVWEEGTHELSTLTPAIREKIARELLEEMRQKLCIATDYLNKDKLHDIERNSQQLKERWRLNFEDWSEFTDCWMVPFSKNECSSLDGHLTLVPLSFRSTFARKLSDGMLWGRGLGEGPNLKKKEPYLHLIQGILKALQAYGIIESCPIGTKKGQNQALAYRIVGAAIQWKPCPERKESANSFFCTLYRQMAELFIAQQEINPFYLHHLKAAEHTAQVDSTERKTREELFRSAQLPLLFCSPTMELGIDIAQLQTVYMRNVPPTPANYAQRSGRAGRSGQASLVLTYCSAYSPHDQYFFQNMEEMVSGVVQIPNIDLANEQLLQSHIHAMWLATSGQELPKSIKELLDLGREEFPVKAELMECLNTKKGNERLFAEACRLVKSVEKELDPDIATWYGDHWLEAVVRGAHRSFSEAFNRWRELYQLTLKQMEKSNSLITNPAISKQERDRANQQYQEVRRQHELLMNDLGGNDYQSDFYTYRYLACQGFLPGYNFPKLPLLAYVPGRREREQNRLDSRSVFLSRPRFLGLSEFGPQALLYHEGAKYRVNRVILRSLNQDFTLPVERALLCPSCGYAHKSFKEERCCYCDSALKGGKHLNELYKIEQVSTVRARRITSDEEERQRQGYELLTTFSFGEGIKRPLRGEIIFDHNSRPLALLTYCGATTIMRMNLGEKRRKDESIFGFHLDVSTGKWAKGECGEDEEAGDKEESVIDSNQTQRVIPFVEDAKNSLVIKITKEMSAEEKITLMYALKRGMELTFQLEESELAAEPLPTKEAPSYFLFYEAAEGGAGVLSRLLKEPSLFANVAREALTVCHYRIGEDGELIDLFKGCEAGCYRCLLSYSNQPMHKKIDRKNKQVLEILLEASKATMKRVAEETESLFDKADGSLEKRWLQWMKEHGYRLPDHAQRLLKEFSTRPDFIYDDSLALIYIDGPHHRKESQRQKDQNQDKLLTENGYTVVRFTDELSNWATIAESNPHIFGSPHREGATKHANTQIKGAPND